MTVWFWQNEIWWNEPHPIKTSKFSNYYQSFRFFSKKYSNKIWIIEQKFLKEFIPDIEGPFTAKIVCNGFIFEKNFPSPPSSEDNSCSSVNYPSTKEQCTNIDLLNSECCYITNTHDSEEYHDCKKYYRDEINSESFVDDTLKFKKIETILYYLSTNDIETLTDEAIKNALKEELSKTETIEYKTFSKTVDYSKIT